MSRNHRKGAIVAALAAAIVLAASSGAMACTIFGGKFTVWGVSPNSSGTVTGLGSGAGDMFYCNGAQPSGQANVGPGGAATREIKLSVADYTCGTKSATLPDGQYVVNYLPDKSSDCMRGVAMGQFTLDGGATPAGGVGPFPIPGLGSDPSGGVLSMSVGGWADVCIDHINTIWGNQVPIFLL